MKKVLLTFAIVLLVLAAQAQIKVHNNGHVSLGCLTQNYGVQVQPNGFTYLRTQNTTDYSWANLSMGNKPHQIHWIVENQYRPDNLCNGQFMFYVYGNGSVFSTGYYTADCPSDCVNALNIHRSIGGEEALSIILGITANYYEEEPEITPEEIENSEYIDAEAVEGMIGDLEKRTVSLSAENLDQRKLNTLRNSRLIILISM